MHLRWRVSFETNLCALRLRKRARFHKSLTSCGNLNLDSTFSYTQWGLRWEIRTEQQITRLAFLFLNQVKNITISFRCNKRNAVFQFLITITTKLDLDLTFMHR